jgi:hypothetical protein
MWYYKRKLPEDQDVGFWMYYIIFGYTLGNTEEVTELNSECEDSSQYEVYNFSGHQHEGGIVTHEISKGRNSGRRKNRHKNLTLVHPPIQKSKRLSETSD